MYKVLKARIIKDGRPVMTFDVNDTVKDDELEAYRCGILARYLEKVALDVVVDLQYKEI